MKHVSVVRESDSRLACDTWAFWYDDRAHVLRCQRFSQAARPTLRHKYRAESEYDAYGRHQSRAPKPEIPDDVAIEAIALFCAGLTVGHFER